jgi:DNA adenine methylase
MDLISARDAAEKWGISPRRVATLCMEGRIEQATLVGKMWVIPANAEKPEDGRSFRYSKCMGKTVRPFLKWAGGKGQLLKKIEDYYPFSDEITKYAEPFVGGGAVLFDILSKYNLREIYISDINTELINTYCVIRDNVNELISLLSLYQSEYLPLDTSARKIYYVEKREQFNKLKVKCDKSENIEKAALMIFLNKTCFNGLYRVNRKGLFNVPMGAYKNPLICDEINLRAVSEKLQNVIIVCGDYRQSADFIDEYTFVYFDPPYRPLTETASFTAYTEVLFDDHAQIELAEFVEQIHQRGAKVLVSNSDPQNSKVEDDFFDSIYASYEIRRIDATRMINCNSAARGTIKELLISNY